MATTEDINLAIDRLHSHRSSGNSPPRAAWYVRPTNARPAHSDGLSQATTAGVGSQTNGTDEPEQGEPL